MQAVSAMNVLNLVDEVKQKLTDQEYKRIVEAIASKSKQAYADVWVLDCAVPIVKKDGVIWVELLLFVVREQHGERERTSALIICIATKWRDWEDSG